MINFIYNVLGFLSSVMFIIVLIIFIPIALLCNIVDKLVGFIKGGD
jgi:hypothetical protein